MKQNPMIETTPAAIAAKQTIEELIQTASNYDVAVLERIYHDDMKVLMVDSQDNVNSASKRDFIELIDAKYKAGDAPMNTWAKFHSVQIDGDKANVCLSRKNDLGGMPSKLFLSIDLIDQDDRWQVTREVVYLQPDNSAEE